MYQQWFELYEEIFMLKEKEMGIPKTIRKGNSTFEFVKKIKDDMYLYQEQKAKYKVTYSRFDLGMLQEEVKPEIEKKNYVRAM